MNMPIPKSPDAHTPHTALRSELSQPQEQALRRLNLPLSSRNVQMQVHTLQAIRINLLQPLDPAHVPEHVAEVADKAAAAPATTQVQDEIGRLRAASEPGGRRPHRVPTTEVAVRELQQVLLMRCHSRRVRFVLGRDALADETHGVGWYGARECEAHGRESAEWGEFPGFGEMVVDQVADFLGHLEED